MIVKNTRPFEVACASELTFTYLGRFFVRGDANDSGDIDLSDVTAILGYLFRGDEGECLDRLDANDSADVDLSDAVYLLNFLFRNRPPPPEPFPDAGVDPTDDGLDCE